MSEFFSRVGEAGFYGIIGMGVIFLVLAIIWGILELFAVIGRLADKKGFDLPADDNEENENQPLPSTDDGDEEIAAITAAVYALLESEAKAENRQPNAFKVVAFRRGRV